MTEYQLLYMGFLRARRDFPGLNHMGHEPGATAANCGFSSHPAPWFLEISARSQRAEVERDFGRSA